MNENEMKALVVGPSDSLFIAIKGDITSEEVSRFREQLIRSRPDLADRVFVMASPDGIDMAVIKNEPKERPSFKGVF